MAEDGRHKRVKAAWLRENTAPIEVQVLKEKLAAAADDTPVPGKVDATGLESTEKIPIAQLQRMLSECQERTEDSAEFSIEVALDGPPFGDDADDQDMPIVVAPQAPVPGPPPVPAPPALGPPPVPRPAPPPVLAPLPAVTAPGSEQAIVAMDLGNTRCRVAALVDEKLLLLQLPGGEMEMPAVVGFDREGNALVGEEAQAMLTTDPAHVVRAPRRLLGRRYKDRGIAHLLAALPMPAGEGADAEVVLELREHRLTVPQICATLLYRLRQVAQYHLDREVTEVVLTRPVSFDQRQTRALTRAAEMAGLTVSYFVEEPVAAAVANRADPGFHDLVGIYDFGGATFNFAVVDLSDQIRVVASASDPSLGGNDFEELLASAAANDLWRRHKIELHDEVIQWQRLLLTAERAKRELSARPETVLKLDAVARTARGAVDVAFPITREQFSRLSESLVERSLLACEAALASAGLQAVDLRAVYLSSGTTYIPAVQQAVARFFGGPPRRAVPPERAVLMGAAIYTVYLRQAHASG
jgi:molecular chaperone DnaK